MKVIKRYDVSAYCYRCGSAEGHGAVEVEYDEDKNGAWVGYHDHKTSLNQIKEEIRSSLEELCNCSPLDIPKAVDKHVARLRELSAV